MLNGEWKKLLVYSSVQTQSLKYRPNFRCFVHLSYRSCVQMLPHVYLRAYCKQWSCVVPWKLFSGILQQTIFWFTDTGRQLYSCTEPYSEDLRGSEVSKLFQLGIEPGTSRIRTWHYHPGTISSYTCESSTYLSCIRPIYTCT